MSNLLNPKQLKFIEHYASGKSGAESARLAGYSAKNAAATASQLLQNEAVKAALDEVRKSSLSAAVYNLEAAMKETNEVIEFSRATKNANAMIKAVEHKAKLNGLLVERHEVKQAGFTIIFSLDEPRAVSEEPALLKEATEEIETEVKNHNRSK